MTTGTGSLTNAEKGVKAHPANSGLLLVVNTAHNIKVVGKFGADELKNGTISTVLITQKGLWVSAMQCKEVEGSMSDGWN